MAMKGNSLIVSTPCGFFNYKICLVKELTIICTVRQSIFICFSRIQFEFEFEFDNYHNY